MPSPKIFTNTNTTMEVLMEKPAGNWEKFSAINKRGGCLQTKDNEKWSKDYNEVSYPSDKLFSSL
jgi:hypothetical protein